MEQPQKLNHRQRRRKAQRELHAAKFIQARLLGCDVSGLSARTRFNIHWLQTLIDKATSWQQQK